MTQSEQEEIYLEGQRAAARAILRSLAPYISDVGAIQLVGELSEGKDNLIHLFRKKGWDVPPHDLHLTDIIERLEDEIL